MNTLLSFNSMKSFSNSKRLFFTFKNRVFFVLCKYSVSIFSFLKLECFEFSILMYCEKLFHFF